MNIHGIDLKPLDPDKAAALQKEMDEQMSGPIRGGFIPPPVAGCHHEWELFPAVGWPLAVCKCKSATFWACRQYDRRLRWVFSGWPL